MSAVVSQPGGGTALNVLGNAITILVHGRGTGGVVSVIESADLPGGGTPPHIHRREDETFRVLEGEYEFQCGDRTFRAGKGVTIFAPRGVPHSYRNIGSVPGLLLIAITPAGFEEFFEEIGALPAQEQVISRVVETGARFGLEFPPPPGG